MARKDSNLIMICASDIAGQLRGKAVPQQAMETRGMRGVGWTPTNALITSFGPIAPSPWGALGDLWLRPDEQTTVDLALPELGIDENFVLGNIEHLDGERWACCLRGQLQSALDDLFAQHGLTLQVAFEHEFHYDGVADQPGLGYSLRAFRRLGEFPNRLMEVLDIAGMTLDTFMPEYGPGQLEVTIGQQSALKAADQAVVLRELVRATARGCGARASFAPMKDPKGVGNGVHVHFSLLDRDGAPVSSDPSSETGLSTSAGAFVAGILSHLPDYLSLTASGVPSYLRLTPHRWSAAFNNLGQQDRESAVRICPVFGSADGADRARKFHFEFRAADACASPYLLLAALVRAGLSGLSGALATPPVTQQDLSTLDEPSLKAIGCERLAGSLAESLERLEHSQWASDTFDATLLDAFQRHKQAEMAAMAGLSNEAVCERYAQAY